jgi:hypothetical protein
LKIALHAKVVGSEQRYLRSHDTAIAKEYRIARMFTLIVATIIYGASYRMLTTGGLAFVLQTTHAIAMTMELCAWSSPLGEGGAKRRMRGCVRELRAFCTLV